MTRRTWGFLAIAACSFTPALTVDHSNLDEGRPVRVEDPYPVSQGEIAVELGPEFISRRRRGEQAAFEFSVNYGAAPNLQLEIETGLFTDPHAKEGPLPDQERSGDVRIGALYNLNQETRTVPALGVKLKANLPTGIDSSGMDAEAKILITKSIGRLSLHANASFRRLDGTEPGERGTLYDHALGMSWPLGAPGRTRTLLVADLFVEQAGRHDEPNTAGAEAGIRRQLTRRVVLDAGVGSELRGPEDRNALTATAGVSIAF